MGFQTYLNESRELNEYESQIVVLAMLAEDDMILEAMNEEDIALLAEGLSDKLGKAGLKLHKGKGILDYVKSFTMGAGKLFLAMIKGDTKKAKAILQTVEKEDILDFLYKLDLGTLHLITGPLHTIDAWTGWDLSVKMKSHMQKAGNIFDEIKHALATVKDKIVGAFDKGVSSKLVSKIGEIEKAVGA